MDSDTGNFHDGDVLTTSRFQSLWKLHVWGPILGWTVACPTDAFANRDLVSKHGKVPAIAGLLADDARSCADFAWPSRWRQGRTRAGSDFAGIWPRADVLLHPASLPDPHSGNSGSICLPPARRVALAWCYFSVANPRGLRSWPAIHLCHVDLGGRDPLP